MLARQRSVTVRDVGSEVQVLLTLNISDLWHITYYHLLFFVLWTAKWASINLFYRVVVKRIDT